ncbi:MAG: hypothetical protein LBT32_09265, partial [Peptococcaceae bacterium]|nr:hypothetical protein [Peptococcaceae bacterium]
RFAVRYGFSLPKDTLTALRSAIQTGVLSKISQDRFTEELMLMYAEEKYREMGRKLLETGILREWIGSDLPWNFADDGLDDTRTEVKERWLLSVILMKAEHLRAVMEHIHLSKENRQHMEKLVGLQEQLLTCRTVVEIDRLLERLPVWFIGLFQVIPELTERMRSYIALLERLPESAVTGKDLVARGVKRGPRIGRILREIRDAWLEGVIRTPQEEQVFLEQRLKGGT